MELDILFNSLHKIFSPIVSLKPYYYELTDHEPVSNSASRTIAMSVSFQSRHKSITVHSFIPE